MTNQNDDHTSSSTGAAQGNVAVRGKVLSERNGFNNVLNREEDFYTSMAASALSYQSIIQSSMPLSVLGDTPPAPPPLRILLVPLAGVDPENVEMVPVNLIVRAFTVFRLDTSQHTTRVLTTTSSIKTSTSGPHTALPMTKGMRPS